MAQGGQGCDLDLQGGVFAQPISNVTAQGKKSDSDQRAAEGTGAAGGEQSSR